MKLLSCFLLFFIYNFNQSQNLSFLPNIKVTYESELNLGAKNKMPQVFVLIGNSQDYYFGGGQNYLNDTHQYEPTGIDLKSISDEFQERIIKVNNTFNVLYTFSETHIRYSEEIQSRWVLYGKTKMIAGIKCQLATTNKYGRRWYAYFSPDYNQKIGPYKFSGLPGLILELYDTRDDYHFTVSKIEKFTDPFEYNLKNYSNFSKQNYFSAKYNLDFEGVGYPQMFGDMKRQYNEMMVKKKKSYNNPIELQAD